MDKLISRFALLLVLLCLGMGARADNVLTITGGSGAPGEEVTVTVSMTNTDAVAALQLSIPLDENLTFVSGSAEGTARLSAMSLSAGVKDGVLNIIVYSATMATIHAGTGDLLTFRLTLGDVPTDIALTPSKLTLSDGSGETISGTSETGEVSIRCAKAQYSTMTVDFGEVPIMDTYHETVTISNVGNEPLEVTALMFSAPEVFSSTTVLPFTVQPGGSQEVDVTYAPTVRGAVTKSMTVLCNSISKLNTIRLTAQPFAVNELHVGDATGIADTEVEVALTMNNMDPIVGFQVEFTLPEALEYVDGSFALDADRKRDHAGYATLQNGVLRLMCYSPTGKALKENDGVIATFRLRLVGRYGVTLTPSKAILSAVIDSQTLNVLSEQYSGNIDIQSPQISASTTLPFGRKPVTEDVTQTYTIWNYGNAPLTVSRIVFLDEGYETSPDPSQDEVTIAAGQSQEVTVTRTDMTEGDFATTMQVYSNDPDQRMLTVSVSGNIFAPNYLSVTADENYQGDDVVLHVATDNYDPIEGIQFELTTSDAFTVNSEATTTTARATGLTVTTRQVDDETLRVVAYLMGSSIAHGSGKVFTLRLTPAEPLALGSHSLTVQNVKLGTAGLQDKYAGEATMPVAYNVQSLLLGDANGDGEVDVRDLVLTVNLAIGNTPPNIIQRACDMNSDNAVDVRDIVLLANFIIGN